MLDILNFVKGSVATKDLKPELTHFEIKNGRITGYNGLLSISSDIPVDIDCNPKALTFIKALENCSETVALTLTDKGRLSIKSGKFKAFIECLPSEIPTLLPQGQFVKGTGNMLTALKTLFPIIAEDASRPWATGVLFYGIHSFATNNIICVRYTTSYDFPIVVNIPRSAVNELIRIGKEPEYIQACEFSVTFYFSEYQWLTTSTLDLAWPDPSRVIDKESNQQTIPEDFFESLQKLKHFTDKENKCYLTQDKILTGNPDIGEGASIDVPGLGGIGAFNLEQLLLLKNIAKTIDWNDDRSCVFTGDNVCGAIARMIVK